MKTKSMFLVMFSYVALLISGSCSEDTDDLLDCIRHPNDCEVDEGSSRELQDGIEVDSTATVSKLQGRDKEYNSGN